MRAGEASATSTAISSRRTPAWVADRRASRRNGLGSHAEAIAAVLERVSDYPHCGRYAAWPGPNSNTFVAWVLRRAGIAYRLGINAIGKSYGKARGDRPRRPGD